MTKLLGLSCVAIVTVLLATPNVECRNITHEDIRDAMMSLVHMYRTSEDKLERHEYREKALGDTLKKMLLGLDKKYKNLEPLKGMLSRLDERLSNVETILMQKVEREKAMEQKTNEALDAIQKTLQSLVEQKTVKPEPVQSPGEADKRIDSIKKDVEEMKNTLSRESLRTMCSEVSSDGKPFEKHISEAEKLLNKYELKLSEYNANSSKVQTDFVPLSEISLADEAWHSKMSEVMEKQAEDIKKIQRHLSDAEGIWKDLARASDLKLGLNHTLTALQDIKDNMSSTVGNDMSKLSQKLTEMDKRLMSTNEDIQRSLTEGNTLSERLFQDVSQGIEALKIDVLVLSKQERVLLQTADNVIANKKQIEYSVHQILRDVQQLVGSQGRQLNKTIVDRFDNIEKTILENQNATFANLSTKIQSEVAQVWRQIGIMYQQIVASKISLDKLTNQTELYVNGSSTTMDNMKNKISLITTKMEEVDANLNYILGRLSVVTTEFNRIKTGLGESLDQVQKTFSAIKPKIEESGPGPHKINSLENETVAS